VCTIYDAMHSMSWILMQGGLGGLGWVGASSRMGWIVLGIGCWVLGVGCWVLGVGCWIWKV
jgi:hypothetical protein